MSALKKHTDDCGLGRKKKFTSLWQKISALIILFEFVSIILFDTNRESTYAIILMATIVWFLNLKIIEFKEWQSKAKVPSIKRTISLIYTHFMTDLLLLILTVSILIIRIDNYLVVASALIAGYTILEYTLNCLLYKVQDSFKEAEVLRMEQELDKEFALLSILFLGYFFFFKASVDNLENIAIILIIASVLMSLFSLIKTLLTKTNARKQNENDDKNTDDNPFDNGTLGIDLGYYCSDTQVGRYENLETHPNKYIELIALCYQANYQKKANDLEEYLITLISIRDTKKIDLKNIPVSIKEIFDKAKEAIEDNTLQDLALCKSLVNNTKTQDVVRIARGLNKKIKKTESKIDKIHLNPTRGFLRILTVIFYLIGFAVSLTLIKDINVFNQENVTFGSIGLGGLYYLTKDFSTSTFAGLRIYIDDLFRVGDRLRINDLGLTGVVTGFNPSTVSIQGDDNSITRVYMSKIIGSTFKNLSRREDKGRLVTHKIKIDTNTIKIINNEEQIKALGLDKCFLLKSYFSEKLTIIENSNNQDETEKSGATKSMQKWLKKIKTTEYTDKDKGDEFENDCKEPLNSRFITNIGAYREYLIRYLNEHNLLDNEQYTMVRYRDASSEGVTIEVRAYTERQYADLYTYEIITSDILEVMLAILPEFRLGLFQAESSTGSDIVINKSNL